MVPGSVHRSGCPVSVKNFVPVHVRMHFKFDATPRQCACAHLWTVLSSITRQGDLDVATEP